MIIYPLLFALLALWGMKLQPDFCNKPEYLSRDESEQLKGLFAVEIMLGHIGLEVSSLYLYPFRKAGILFVAMFFCLSGYGLKAQYNKKPQYLENKFLLKRLVPLFSIFIVANLIIGTVHFLYTGTFTRTHLVLLPTEESQWFIWAIAVFYVIFFIAYRFANKKPYIALLICTTAFTLLCYWLMPDLQFFYGSCYGFVVGIFFADYIDKIKAYMAGIPKFVITVLLSFLITGAGIIVFFFDETSFTGNVVARNIASTAFACMFMVLLIKLKFSNRALGYLSKFYMELYYMHPLAIFVASRLPIKSYPVMLSAVCIIFSIVFAALFSLITKSISGLCKRIIQ